MAAIALVLMRRAILLLVLVGACDDSGLAVDGGVDAGLDAAPAGQGSEPTGDLLVNEISPRGDGPDWVELHNRGAAPIDLCGYFLTDAADRLDHYFPLGGALPPDPCPPIFLEAGGYRVIFLDGTALGTPIDPLHASWKIGPADEVHLVSTTGHTVDGVLFLYPRRPDQPADVTLSRLPDGDGLFYAAPPSPGLANPAVQP